MKDGYWLGRDHPGVYQGQHQALNEDYTHSGFDRGHLNPNGHHAGNAGSTLLVNGEAGTKSYSASRIMHIIEPLNELLKAFKGK